MIGGWIKSSTTAGVELRDDAYFEVDIYKFSEDKNELIENVDAVYTPYDADYSNNKNRSEIANDLLEYFDRRFPSNTPGLTRVAFKNYDSSVVLVLPDKVAVYRNTPTEDEIKELLAKDLPIFSFGHPGYGNIRYSYHNINNSIGQCLRSIVEVHSIVDRNKATKITESYNRRVASREKRRQFNGHPTIYKLRNLASDLSSIFQVVGKGHNSRYIYYRRINAISLSNTCFLLETLFKHHDNLDTIRFARRSKNYKKSLIDLVPYIPGMRENTIYSSFWKFLDREARKICPKLYSKVKSEYRNSKKKSLKRKKSEVVTSPIGEANV